MTISHIYLVKTHSGSLYEIQVNNQGGSRCRKNTEPWRTVKTDSLEYLERLCIGPSFDVPGVVLTSMVKDYQHFVPSGEPKRIGGLSEHVIAQVRGSVRVVRDDHPDNWS